ncbi:MAG: zinc metallopeptidase [Verrucomicrobiae bacterium]|nr:zinc metallopeptidase [Verrucomicrobiae bacterium]
MYMFHWYELVPIPGVLLGFYAMFKLRSLYSKYQNVPQSKGMTGAEVAQAILDKAGVREVRIEGCEGELTDHYDPRGKVLRLSEANFRTSSLAAIGVAAHEAGHAIQHHVKYAPLETRMAVVGVTNFASISAPILFMIGMFMHSGILLQIGIWLFSAIVVFQAITLPVEFNASARAKRVLLEMGIVSRDEEEIVKKLLNAAALTYVAGLVTAALELLKMILYANLQRDRD